MLPIGLVEKIGIFKFHKLFPQIAVGCKFLTMAELSDYFSGIIKPHIKEDDVIKGKFSDSKSTKNFGCYKYEEKFLKK